MYTVYILHSLKDSSHYIGYTSNITDRLQRHNEGRSRFTRSKMPWKLVYSEEYESRQEAMKRERQIKSYKGGIAFKNLLNNFSG